MNNYTDYKKQPKYIEFSGNFHFNAQLNQEGSVVKANEYMLSDNDEPIEYKIIIREHSNEYNDNKEERILLFGKECNLKTGDIFEYLNEFYLITTHVDTDNPFMNGAKALLCNNTINWKGLKRPVPCIVEGESYGVKIVSSNELREGVDTKVRITTPNNIITSEISPNKRYIFDHSKYGIYEVGDITVYKKGKLILTCKKSDYLPEDDLENNIAFNKNIDTPVILPTSYVIIGEENVKRGREYSYKLDPINQGIEWSISDNTVATMKIDDNKNCILSILKSDNFVSLSASLNGEIIATKDLFTY